MTDLEKPRRWLGGVWWLLCPAFAVLVGRIAADRACGDPYWLLPEATSHPGLAWPIAALYLSGYLWLVGVYLVIAARMGTPLPSPSDVRTVWTGDLFKVWIMLIAVAVDSTPVGLWRWLGGNVVNCGS